MHLNDKDVVRRVKERYKSLVSPSGILILKGTVHRTQSSNKSDVLNRLKSLIDDVKVPDKERDMRDIEFVSDRGKKVRREEKGRRKKKKSNRGAVKNYD
eukprot:CAMPEP_0118651168 /NCGR_PEP_ID=MMETSP0785-20121206/10643_1 /TAXON_ID=91992 /ORGANISM="Bolidomonas pacifica, Strain CCMP 1866" /LENGTH=98 /DNA_ID=CAMNT_0006543605 /DNA_START=359 /DNA_END=655 /DNA_ORIENTATION=+